MTSPSRKKNSRAGISSCIFASFPLITLGLIILWDNVQNLEPPFMVWLGFVLVGAILSPIIGLITGLVGISQKEKSRVHPMIGIIACLIWIFLLVYGACNFTLPTRPF